MGVYLRAKFEHSSIVLTSFSKGGGVILPPSPTSKRTPKKPIQIRANIITRKNESKILTKDKSCKFNCRFDGKNM